MTNPHPTTKSTNGWTPERRLKQSQAIRHWSPWTKSTGPRSPSGKARAAQNAAKPWLKDDPERRLVQALAAQRRYITAMNRHLALSKKMPENELMELSRKALRDMGRDCTIQLLSAMIYAKLCKNLAFLPPLRQIVNANDNG